MFFGDVGSVHIKQIVVNPRIRRRRRGTADSGTSSLGSLSFYNTFIDNSANHFGDNYTTTHNSLDPPRIFVSVDQNTAERTSHPEHASERTKETQPLSPDTGTEVRQDTTPPNVVRIGTVNQTIHACCERCLGEVLNHHVPGDGIEQIDGEKLVAPEFEGLFHMDRAVGYHNLHSEAYKLVDANLLAALGQMFSEFSLQNNGASKSKLPGDMSWSSIMEVFRETPFFQVDGTPTQDLESCSTAYSRKVPRNLGNSWKRRTEILQSHVKSSRSRADREAVNWFQKNLIKDPNVRDSVKLDIKAVVRDQTQAILDLITGKPTEGKHPEMLAGARKSSALSKSYRNKSEKTFLDVGVLRFHDFQDPHIQVYRIQLTVWSEVSVKDLQVRSGIRGVYNSCQFRPRTSFLRGFQQEALDLAKARVIDCLFKGADIPT